MHEMYREDEEKALSGTRAHEPFGAFSSRAGRGFTEDDQERIATDAHAAAAARAGAGGAPRRTGLGFGSSGGGGGGGGRAAPGDRGGAPVLSAAERIRQRLSGGGSAGSASSATAGAARARAQAAAQLGRVAGGDRDLGCHPVAARDWGRQGSSAAAGRPPDAFAAALVGAIESSKVTSLNATDYRAYQKRELHHAGSDEVPGSAAARRSEVAHYDAIFSATGSVVPVLDKAAADDAADPRWEARVVARNADSSTKRSTGDGWKEKAISYEPRGGLGSVSKR